MDITKFNIETHLNEIIKNIQSCAFISLDSEFSGLRINDIYRTSLFDSAAERYTKVRKGFDGIVATQMGISTFHYARDENAYRSATYTFYLSPQAIGNINQCITFEASAVEFLMRHKFDFNKILYEGIPYLNKFEEEVLKKDIENEYLEASLNVEDMDLMVNYGSEIQQWLSSPDAVPSLSFSGSLPLCYTLMKRIKKDYPALDVRNLGYEVKINKTNKKPLADGSEDERLLKLAAGFSVIIKEIVKAKKPLVLHNALLDLMILSNQFLEPLPLRYDSFKNNIHDLFPKIFDTKFISFEMQFLVKKVQFAESTSLQNLYEFFKDSKGRVLALHSPLIKMLDGYDPTPHYHQAGWDSFCTGYCFIRLCHWAASKKFEAEKVMTSIEHLTAMESYANKVNLSRASQPHLCFGKEDPSKHRPEILYVETLCRERINISQVINTLSHFGSVDVKQYGKSSALVAVTNNICAKKILTNKQNRWSIAKYSALRHSVMARIALWGSVVVSSGSLLALILHRISN